MFVGRSEEEIALAGEEMGWNPLQAVKNIFSSPAAPIAAGLIIGPAAGAAITLARAAAGYQQPAAKAAKAAKPDQSSESQPQTEPSTEDAPVSKKKSSSTDSMGTSALSDEHIEGLINRERDPDKKARMVYNHQRAIRMRGSNMGAAFGVVDAAIGALFARTPVDAQSRPSMGPSQIHQLIALVAKKVGSKQKARALVASYVRINKIATPGLRVVRKG
jgi:hypothetical protein